MRYAGHIQYGLVKLDSLINQSSNASIPLRQYFPGPQGWKRLGGIVPEEVGEDGLYKAPGESSGLQTTLTGRCTELRNVGIAKKRDRSRLRRTQPTDVIE